ncbi:MAG TPA: alanine racemase [Bryobacteraceae bacterium]|nr:alanine racemase [Bryobacteraceae bacterium]
MSPHFRSYALISRDRIARNYRAVRQAVGPAVEIAGVVKANAYGHGAAEVSRVLIGEGARWLAVSSVEEGVALRDEGIRARILVMAGFLPFELEAVAEYNLTPAVPSLSEIAALDRMAEACGRPLPYHLKLDTGMGRLGTLAEAGEIARAIEAAQHARCEGLMSHLASASDFTTSQTCEQISRFEAIRGALAAQGIAPPILHLAATHAILYPRGNTPGNLVRVGLSLYGYLSPAKGDAPPAAFDVAPTLTWKARILSVKDVPAGAPLGYNASFHAPRAMRVAVVAAGYADGIFQCLSNRGSVIAAGKLTPILGSVCMDTIIVDVSHAPALVPGDEVTLLGTEGDVTLDAARIAETAGTISYAVLCAIGQRVRRVYI